MAERADDKAQVKDVRTAYMQEKKETTENEKKIKELHQHTKCQSKTIIKSREMKQKKQNYGLFVTVQIHCLTVAEKKGRGTSCRRNTDRPVGKCKKATLRFFSLNSFI